MSIDIVLAKACAKTAGQTLHLGSKPYNVFFSPHVGWTCECPGFQYRGKCKHVVEAEQHTCLWGLCNEGVCFTGTECPSCGGPLIDIKVAV